MTRNHQFILTEEAKFEVKESYNWYEKKLRGLGERFLNDFEACCDRIDQKPGLYKVEYRNQRQGQLKKFPFIVMYEKVGPVIWVNAIFHTSQEPGGKYRD